MDALTPDEKEQLSVELERYFKSRADRIEKRTGKRPELSESEVFIDTTETLSMWR